MTTCKLCNFSLKHYTVIKEDEMCQSCIDWINTNLTEYQEEQEELASNFEGSSDEPYVTTSIDDLDDIPF